MTLYYRVCRKLLQLYYRLRPDSLTVAIKTVNMLSPGSQLIYYARYADGCTRRGMYNGYVYFEGDEGRRHAPHLAFIPDDEPVYEWGISGLKNGQELTEQQLNELSHH